MSRRETALQLAFVALAVVLSVLWLQFGAVNTFSSALYLGTFYVIVFAGTHVVLALRGDGEDVPVAARWRFVALVVALAVATSVGAAAGQTAVAGVSLSVVLGPTVAALFVAYLLYEAREGYRASRRP